ncbi:MAG: DUF3596 domain-containing protein [Desulfobulbaceae bacterium]|nr:DUF3596 domain-containing protein [Desulfobulbaceae bacterium]
MGSVRVRIKSNNLFFDFTYRGKRCREQTKLEDTGASRKKLEKILERIEAEITLGTFDYAKYFPNSPNVGQFTERKVNSVKPETPLFSEFAAMWVNEMKIQWRATHHKTTLLTLEKYLNPAFGEKEIGKITKAEILQFRAGLASVKGRKNASLSPSRLNHIMNPMRMILNEAACRHNFSSPYNGIKSLKVPRTDVEPFSLDEVSTIINEVRDDFRNYYTVRFFTGMRTGEIDGLQWQHVDFERRKINIRQALAGGELIYTKNDGSFREIDMSMPVFEALQEQKAATSMYQFVFCTRGGTPLNHNNVTNRVWLPLLRNLGLRRRRPYQTRHTAATLWLGAGENPEWIARQMGHTTTEMLFRVYSRFVPNLTRQDGSAFERLIGQSININIQKRNNL